VWSFKLSNKIATLIIAGIFLRIPKTYQPTLVPPTATKIGDQLAGRWHLLLVMKVFSLIMTTRLD